MPQKQQKLLVVDGSIEDGKPPYILLSTSLDYFSSINLQVLQELLVSGAVVTISDGTVTTTLKEYRQPLGLGYYLIHYGSDSADPAGLFLGKQGSSYTLTIKKDQEIYTSVTTIPVVTKTIDSLWWKTAPNNADTSKVVLMARITDPKGFGNYIRYYTKVDSAGFLPGANSTFDDQVVDGTTYDAEVDQGVDRNNPPGQDDYGYFKRGDTITVKVANIDKATYDFWRTLEFGYQSVGNPFSSPVKILGNVSNGALGAFCGYGVQYKTLIVPQ